ncbi:phosphotransferase [Ammoniphilus resinae]|uniref:CotS family spore coat protein n=1 Tax=Ammoniphilus resinae TaxID=861532 RepID=A0ABS4GQ58_9BACL|nr:phosphotransferase [Ammoniphilus resinae]MBP1932408.1 CotS family spore coat protein [Ammoniphilus resinae]
MSKLSHAIEDAYGLRIEKLDKIKTVKESSYVAKIKTTDGKKYVVKSLFIPKDRQQFIAETEVLLGDRGVKLANPVPTERNQLYIMYENSPYVLYEWVKGKSQSLRRKKELYGVVKSLGRFHHSSVGLSYSRHTNIYSENDWVSDYQNRLDTMKNWKERHAGNRTRKHKYILKTIPFFQKMGRLALKKLKSSSYQSLISKPYPKLSLVHGDFHQNNIIVNKNRKFFIDFEDVRYDLPSKDLIRIFEMYTRIHTFNGKEFKKMLKKYEETNPLSAREKQLLFIDFLFPHIFEKNLRKGKYSKLPLSRVKHQIAQEKRKIRFIYREYFK